MEVCPPRKHDEALANCRRAVEIRDSCPLAHGLLASALNYAGDPREAVKYVRKALEHERIYPPWMVNVLATAYRDGDMLGLSIPAAKESVRIDGQQIAARLILCIDYHLSDAHDRARLIANEILTMAPEFRLSSYALTQPYRDQDLLNAVVFTLHDAGLPN